MDRQTHASPPAPGGLPAETKEQAQRRADQIGAFSRELTELEGAGVLALTADQGQRIRAFHGEILDRFARLYDVDRSDAQKSVSLGMRIASFIGALALSAAVFLFFYRFWGDLATPAQVAILGGVPLVALVGVDQIGRRERTRYFTGLMAIVAFACFILDTSVINGIFNRVFEPWEMLPWAALALLLAYNYRLRLPLVAGIALLMGYVASQTTALTGIAWGMFMARPETMMLAGALALGIAAVHPRDGQRSFVLTWRILGGIGLLFPIVIPAVRGELSLLTGLGIPARAIQIGYDVVGFAAAIASIWIGIRRQWREIVNTGSAFFVVFLYAKLVDWYWAWMPRYLFFLIVGLIAVALLVALKQIRARYRQV
jgi:uncharacterized membrane protein